MVNTMKAKSIVFFTMLLVVALQVQAEDYYKEINKRFAVNSNVYLHINGSFSNYTVTTWDSNEMEVIIKMNVETKSQERADKIFASASVRESATSPEIRVEPSFGTKWGVKEEVDIFVEVRMPKTGGIAADVSFGNWSASSLIGQVNIKVDYGNVTIGELFNSANEINVEFGNINISQFGGGTIDCSYGNVKVNEAGATTTMEVAFGNLDLYGLRSDCKSLTINGEYGNIDLELGESSGYQLVASSSFGNIKVPSGLKKSLDRKDYTDESIEGVMGNGTVKVNVSVSFGNVDVD